MNAPWQPFYLARCASAQRTGIDGAGRSSDHRTAASLPSHLAEISLRAFVILLLSCLMTCVGLARAASAPTPLPAVQDAQRAGWDTASLLTQALTAADPKRFPGMQAWLKEYRAVGGVPGKRAAAGPVAKIDVDRLVSRNPAFWRAYFEMSPGDSGAMLLHASLLLAGGEASRAAYVLIIARQTIEIDKALLQAMNELLVHAQRAITAGTQQTGEAVKLYEQGGHMAALPRLKATLDAWPANGIAHYETGLALLAQQYAASGQPPPSRARLGLHSDVSPSRDVRAAYERARLHDPLLIRAYQGDETDSGDVLLVLGKTVRPLWDIIARDIKAETQDDVLRNLAAGLRAAGLAELALALGQVVIGREGGSYDEEDRKTLAIGLRALAPAAVDPVVKRLAQPRPELVRLVMP